MTPLTAATHLFVLAGTHRADASGEQNDRDLFGRQCNLELLEENKFQNPCCALRQGCCHIALLDLGRGAPGAKATEACPVGKLPQSRRPR
jgi:hypothetical protein